MRGIFPTEGINFQYSPITSVTMYFVIPQTITKSDVNEFPGNNDVMCIS